MINTRSKVYRFPCSGAGVCPVCVIAEQIQKQPATITNHHTPTATHYFSAGKGGIKASLILPPTAMLTI
jgi:hypothetical protein